MTPIVNANGITVGPENSDKLAQRILQIIPSGNPGSLASRRIPQTFDLRPIPPLGAVAGELLDYPDELMIDWGNTPLGSTASIYWPQVEAIDVIRLASQLYGTDELSLSDPNTLQCKVNGGVTYVPIPSGGGQRFAGLFTVDLPPGVVKGEEFNIVARRFSSRQIGDLNIATGAQVKIPVAAENILRLSEENTYAILLWRLSLLSPSSRWYPVLQRHLSYIGARVDAFGGNATTIRPSPTGVPAPSGQPGPGLGTDELTGKVAALIYDRFGDFEGFLLMTEGGSEHAFHKRIGDRGIGPACVGRSRRNLGAGPQRPSE